jgi:hypothetical protein
MFADGNGTALSLANVAISWQRWYLVPKIPFPIADGNDYRS